MPAQSLQTFRRFAQGIEQTVCDPADAGNMGSYGNPLLRQYGFRYGSGKDQRRCQPAGKMPAAPVIVKAFIPHLACVIRVTGTHHIFQDAVILGMLIAVGNQHAKGRTCRLSLKNAAFDGESVLFLALGTLLL